MRALKLITWKICMNLKNFVFELLSQGLLALSSAWLFLVGYASPGLLIVSGILLFLTVATRVKYIAEYLSSLYVKTNLKTSSSLQ